MKQFPLNDYLRKAMEDLRKGISGAMFHMQEAMQAYLSNSIDMEELLKMVEGMGIGNINQILQGNVPGFDPYKILGLEKTATDDEVKERYKQLLHKIHPDVSGIKGTEFLTQLLVMAYEMIEKDRKWK